MLVLSRKIGEQIVLPIRGVNIVVLAIHGKRVRLGIEAPPEEPVHRVELLKHKHESESSKPSLAEA